MRLWLQIVVTLALLSAAVPLAARYLPASHPWLDRVGLLTPMSSLGFVAEAGRDTGQPAGQTARRGHGGSAYLVVARPLEERALNEEVAAIGSARGVRAVSVAAEVNGRIDAIIVAAGERVEQGQVIAKLDSRAARFAVEKADLLLQDARAALDRAKQLSASGAGSALQLQEAELTVRTAELSLHQAEYDLSQHTITAPIAGWVGLIAEQEGSLVDSGTEITRIEDRSSLIIDFRVPERVVSRLTIGDALQASPLADPTLVLPGRILALDNRVDETSRTLRVQAAIENRDDRLRAGMAFRISIGFTGDPHLAVDPLAIQWGATGAFVWAVRDGKAKYLPVRILQRNAEAVLIEAETRPGDLIVTEGVQSLRDGVEVTLADAPT